MKIGWAGHRLEMKIGWEGHQLEENETRHQLSHTPADTKDPITNNELPIYLIFLGNPPPSALVWDFIAVCIIIQKYCEGHCSHHQNSERGIKRPMERQEQKSCYM